MHDIERYGIGKSELAAWRNAKHATLLFLPRGEGVTLTLLADDLLIGRHTVGTGQFADALASYAGFWHAGGAAGGANAQARSFVSAFGIAGQGVEPGLPPHTPPKGYPTANFLIHTQLQAFVTLASQTERGG
ncbi:MAG TPA: hypothetical protein VFQ65_18770 [Kofleriaceae bacterium]|nr:hypothetical protein [Kofleriaceae bacterium]